MKFPPLMTDLYQLTMLAGYVDAGRHETPAVFELFYRDEPFAGGYAVFAGLQPALDYLEQLRFSEEDLAYLRQLDLFKQAFIEFLASFRFAGRVSAPPEGSIVFANEPLLTVEAPLAQAQFVETALLNIVNFQTLVATKASRLVQAAGSSQVIEFGLRRAQGPDGAMSVARAACIGGVGSTSNVQAGKRYGLPVKGTHAHSWIMSFADELSAFRAYVKSFPDSSILLVDTYDTLESGLPNAITVAGEMRQQGHELAGIRLDSGDLAALSRTVREQLDQAGFPGVKIVASNDLDEEAISEIRNAGGCIDIYGVGTRLAICAGEQGGALGGVYKLVSIDGQPRLKTTSDPQKATLPGAKRVWRVSDGDDMMICDIIACVDEKPAKDRAGLEELLAGQNLDLPAGWQCAPLGTTVMETGTAVTESTPLEDLAAHHAAQIARLPESFRRQRPDRQYPILLSPGLAELRTRLTEDTKT